MARPTEWRRQIDEYANLVAKQNLHVVQWPSIDADETIGRIRFSWQATHSTDQPFDAAGFVVVTGIIVVPAGLDPIELPFPFDSPNEDWMWWETEVFQTPAAVVSDSTFFEVDAAPTGNLQRDCRAQRKADVSGSDVYFIAQSSSLSAGQSDFYLSVATSMLVILPA